MGYPRTDSRAGIRNYIAVISTVSCANHVVNSIAAGSEIAVPVVHETGCLQFAQDLEMTKRTILNMGYHPNAGAVIYVGLGCEQVDTKSIANSITTRPVRYLLIQEEGGTRGAIARWESKSGKYCRRNNYAC
ncbi:MAG: UxaA family hydrolase [Acetivibrionales bacterium]